MAEPQFSRRDIDQLMAVLREKIIRLSGTGENWQVTINGTPNKASVECREFHHVQLVAGQAKSERRGAEASSPGS